MGHIVVEVVGAALVVLQFADAQPYVEVSVGEQGDHKYTKPCNPNELRWNEIFLSQFSGDSNNLSLCIKIKDAAHQDRVIGTGVCPLKGLLFGRSQDKILPLSPRGFLHLRVTPLDFGVKPPDYQEVSLSLVLHQLQPSNPSRGGGEKEQEKVIQRGGEENDYHHGLYELMNEQQRKQEEQWQRMLLGEQQQQQRHPRTKTASAVAGSNYHGADDGDSREKQRSATTVEGTHSHPHKPLDHPVSDHWTGEVYEDPFRPKQQHQHSSHDPHQTDPKRIEHPVTDHWTGDVEEDPSYPKHHSSHKQKPQPSQPPQHQQQPVTHKRIDNPVTDHWTGDAYEDPSSLPEKKNNSGGGGILGGIKGFVATARRESVSLMHHVTGRGGYQDDEGVDADDGLDASLDLGGKFDGAEEQEENRDIKKKDAEQKRRETLREQDRQRRKERGDEGEGGWLA